MVLFSGRDNTAFKIYEYLLLFSVILQHFRLRKFASINFDLFREQGLKVYKHFIMKTFLSFFLIIGIFGLNTIIAQDKSLVNTSQSPYGKLKSINMSDVKWTTGFWAERFNVCKESMVPHMMGNYLDPGISYAVRANYLYAGVADIYI